MKALKKILASVIALVYAFTLATPALAAATDTTISVSTDDNHTYEVYQIMTGELSVNEENKNVLSNAQWGTNAKHTGPVTADEMAVVTAITGTDVQKAAALSAYVDFTTKAVGKVKAGEPLTVKTGYYLVKDVTNPVPAGDSLSLYVVKVVGPTTINPKKGTTTSQKKVLDEEAPNNTWNDSADYDIGDAVPFQLKAIVASDYDNYNNGYKLTFHDKESAGLTFNKNSVKVYVDRNEITTGFTVTAPAADGDTFDVAFANLKDIAAVHAGSVITVEYTSTLNENAKIGAEGNPNTSHITYTNNPNDTQAGENGKTPDDTVIVFTYKVVVNKYANEVAEGNKLTGAEFTLTKGDEVIAVVKSTDGTQFTFSGLDAGTYTLTETKTPVGYNTIDPITIVVTATHDVEADAPTLKTLTVIPGESFTVEMTGEGENATPTGTITGNVVNKSGTTLPETGGMGTTLFYVVGGMMMIGAAVLLITKKRMEA